MFKFKDEKNKTSVHVTDHLANERTFLAWIRTAVGIMAFGFVVEKFALFIKQIAILLGRSHALDLSEPIPPIQGHSSVFGVFLVALGAVISLLAFFNYRQVGKQIEDNVYYPSMFLDVVLTACVLLMGLFLAIYLSSSV